MTKFDFSDKMYKLSAREREEDITSLKKLLKKVEKNFQKGIDKRERVWYNNRAVAKAAAG